MGRLLRSLVLCLPLIACADPASSGDEDDSDELIEGLTEADVEAAASRALSKADRSDKDFESGETATSETAGGETTPNVSATDEIRPLAITTDLGRALGAGTWAYAFRVTRDGKTSTDIASSETKKPMYAASVFKVITGFTAFANDAVKDDTLTFMLRTSNNALANYSMCKAGAKLGRYGATCSSVAFATQAMKMNSATTTTIRWLRDDQDVSFSSAFALKDGSGLLPTNRMTVDDIMGVLMAARRHDEYARFKNMLAQPGKASTLRSRFAGLEGKVYAKTGTYPRTGNGVKTLAGFVELGGGRTMVFAVFGNGVGSVSPAMSRIESAVRKAMASAQTAAK